ncbi:MAG TPA: hypothetical protein VGD73_14035 [Pseudonocardia sp.]|uniref:hypothetical protein n=1 Tax=Pseudonocardia sp. TaxID=60912 RepID=UPI002ED9BFB1
MPAALPVLWPAAPEDAPVLWEAEAPPGASPAAAFEEAPPPAFEDCPPVFSEGALCELPVEAPDPLPGPRAELRAPPDCADRPVSEGAPAGGAPPRCAELCPPPTPRGCAPPRWAGSVPDWLDPPTDCLDGPSGAPSSRACGGEPTVPLIGTGPLGPSARMDWVGSLGVIPLTSSRTATTAGSGATCPPSAVAAASEPTASTAPVALASRMRGEAADCSPTR